jgi:hypothetical protein
MCIHYDQPDGLPRSGSDIEMAKLGQRLLAKRSTEDRARGLSFANAKPVLLANNS